MRHIGWYRSFLCSVYSSQVLNSSIILYYIVYNKCCVTVQQLLIRASLVQTNYYLALPDTTLISFLTKCETVQSAFEVNIVCCYRVNTGMVLYCWQCLTLSWELNWRLEESNWGTSVFRNKQLRHSIHGHQLLWRGNRLYSASLHPRHRHSFHKGAEII